MKFFGLRGYATTFLQAEHYAGSIEFFDRDAFRDQLFAPGRIFLNYGSHSAESICQSVTLFADDYGLGFLASIPAATWPQIRNGVLRDCQYCSVNLVSCDREDERLGDGTIATRLTRARIDHVTICANPVFAGTGVWPADVQGNLPPRLARLAAHWELGRSQWLAAEKRRASVSASAMRTAQRQGGLNDLLASRTDHYRNFRLQAAAYVARHSTEAFPVMCHVAFTKAAGFDEREFAAQVADARASWRGSGR